MSGCPYLATEGRTYRLAGAVQCLRCRRKVELWENGDVQDDGSVIWSGVATNQCCGLLFADDWESCKTYRLPS